MRETRLSGSVEGVMGNHDSYSDSQTKSAVYANRAAAGNRLGSETEI
jgi:hypothetical protein